MLPYRTDEGLYLEDEGVLIPWGTPLDPTRPPVGAEVERNRVFRWNARHALGGLFGDLFAVLWDDEAVGFPRSLRALHFLSMNLAVDAHATSRVLLERLHDQFTDALGPASFSYPCYDSGLPFICWMTDNLHYCCHAGLKEVCIHLQHVPTEPAQLRAEWDRKQREYQLQDARVPFVAWDHQDPRFSEEARRRHQQLVEHEARLRADEW